MKKLFALVMVLAMALAIAMPTLAATGWDKPATTPPTYDDFEMAASKYEWYATSTGGYGANGVYFPDWDDKKGVVQDTLGRVYFEYVIPTAADVAALYPGVDFSNLTVKVKITNVKAVKAVDLTATPVVYDPVLGTSGIDSKGVFTATLTAPAPQSGTGAKAQALDAMFVFRAAKAADVVATITISAGAAALPTTFLYKTKTINVGPASASELAAYSADWSFWFPLTSGYSAVLFDTDSADKIQRVFLLSGSTYYQVLVDVNGAITFKNGDASLQVGQDGYATLKAEFDFFMGALGFAWDGTAKYMTSQLILDNLIKSASGSASVTFPAGYQSIVDPTVKPPQTGDASTVVGFVMIALALVAAAAVTVKKVRA